MSAEFTNPIHLYRSLLRESSYLFDSNVRAFTRHHVTDQFRRKCKSIPRKNWRHLGRDCTQFPTLRERYHLKLGRRLLSVFQRANQGHINHVNTVLKWTYGRTGPRRRALMREILTDDRTDATKWAKEVKPNAARDQKTSGGVAENASTLRSGEASLSVAHIEAESSISRKFGRGWSPPQRFRALLLSQTPLQSLLADSGKLTIVPNIASLNSWGLPMPECRWRNQTQSWYAKTASLLCPYLNEAEWDQLKDKSNGIGIDIPKRRNLGTVRVFGKETETVSVSATDAGDLLDGPTKPTSVNLRRAMGNPHKMTTRFLSRRYAELLRNTPKIVLGRKEQAAKHENGGSNAENPGEKEDMAVARTMNTVQGSLVIRNDKKGKKFEGVENTMKTPSTYFEWDDGHVRTLRAVRPANATQASLLFE